jgi:hypothetical protein
MKSEKIYCQHCGTKNSSLNNNCENCGIKLNKIENNGSDLTPHAGHKRDYSDIRSAIKTLITTNGYIIITVDNFFVQFAYDLKKEALTFEATRNDDSKDADFEKLAFSIDDYISVYRREILSTDLSIDSLITEIKFIFENIYRVKLINYEIESDFKAEKSSFSIREYLLQTIIGIIFFAILVGACFLMKGCFR